MGVAIMMATCSDPATEDLNYPHNLLRPDQEMLKAGQCRREIACARIILIRHMDFGFSAVLFLQPLPRKCLRHRLICFTNMVIKPAPQVNH